VNDADAADVRALADALSAALGQPQLSDQARTALGDPRLAHTLLRDDSGRVTGYAQRDGREAEVLAASPAVAARLLDAVGPGALIWSHGTASPLGSLLAGCGARAVRTLHQLRRPAGTPIPDVAVPADVRLRAFVPGRDEDGLLVINAAAFAEHPEQGRWTRADLLAREAEDWFDPDGLFLAEADGGALLGFHWTKRHPDGAGEVYVIATDPAAQGRGLGAALLVRGLAHLDSSGCPYVLLYVDDDNRGALRLYERYGFARHDADTQWQL
jgi:mycothiol synthase